MILEAMVITTGNDATITCQKAQVLHYTVSTCISLVAPAWEQSRQGDGGIDNYDGGREEEQQEEAQDEENSPAVNDGDDHTTLSSGDGRNIRSLGTSSS